MGLIHDDYEEMLAEIKALRAENTRLLQDALGLGPWLNHSRTCARPRSGTAEKCDCGLQEATTFLKPALDAATERPAK